MNAKNLILGLSVAAIGLSSCCNTSTKTNVSLKNEADTASFYIGYMYGSNITGNGIEDINMDAIIAGMNSALQKKPTSGILPAMTTRTVRDGRVAGRS